MDKVTGMTREDMKSIRDQMGTVTCMSLEGLEWSISIVEQEAVQDCGDVIYLIVMVHSRVYTSTLGLWNAVMDKISVAIQLSDPLAISSILGLLSSILDLRSSILDLHSSILDLLSSILKHAPSGRNDSTYISERR